MGLYNFQPRFVPFIESGEKTHTIRSYRAHSDGPGDTCHLYTGLRRRGARLLMRVPCVKIEGIEIAPSPARLDVEVYVNMLRLDRSEKDALAKRDGFADFADMVTFWNGRLPFTGQIIHWDFQKRRME